MLPRSLKIFTVFLLLYVIVGGFLLPVPELAVLQETIRVLYFHVPMWFAMIFMFSASVFYSLMYLKTSSVEHDHKAIEFANIGVFLGILGITTGMLWAQFTWGKWWSFDPKQNGAAITLLIYLAYLILRSTIDEYKSRARVSAVYNVFAFAAMVPLIFILPRITDSLHPGAGGNPGFNTYDLDSTMRLVFYPAVIGWSLLAFWLVEQRIRLRKIEITNRELHEI